MPDTSPSHDLLIENLAEVATPEGTTPRRGADQGRVARRRGVEVLCRDGLIAFVGTPEERRRECGECEDAERLDGQGGTLIPGFVDPHTHLPWAGTREEEFISRLAGTSYQEIAAAGGGILSTVAATRRASAGELTANVRRRLDLMLAWGTTTAEAKSGYGLERDTELRMLRAIARLSEEGPVEIAATLLAAHTVPQEFAERRGEYVRWVAEELIPEVAAARLARYCDVFCDDHAFTVDEARVVLGAAKKYGLGLRVHAEQFRPGTGAALAAELGAATADHLEVVEEDTLRALKAAGVQPVLLPGSVFALGRTQYPPARTMIAMGLGVVLATDFNPGSSPIASMPLVMSLACLEMKMTPAEALTASTINAACSLGLGAEVGLLEPGKRADFLIHEFTDYRELAYFIAAPARPRVFIAGQEVTR